jgi:RNA polymerase-binding protein DksA
VPTKPAEKWSRAELNAVRKELESQADELRSEIDEAETTWAKIQAEGGGEGAGDDQADAGTKTFEREHEMSLANNSRDLLAQVERALERVANGTYGACEICGNPIGKPRLMARPAATLCVNCKQREERR